MKLYGIGLGPGDPELLTVKAARILSSCPVIFTVVSAHVTDSVSEGIVSSLNPKGRIIRLVFSMSRDRKIREEQVLANAKTIIAELSRGQDCAYTTLGDTLSYSTFGYILPLVKKALPEVCVDIVPGITSWSTLAAQSGSVLVENRDILKVVSPPGRRLRHRAALSLWRTVTFSRLSLPLARTWQKKSSSKRTPQPSF